jgi:malonyl CoA-acyl carrier protein transacylase
MYNPDLFKKAEPNITEEEQYVTVPNEEDFDKIENGIHVRTGLVDAVGLMTVVNNCTNCHSAKLVTQNRMNKERWVSTIRWMQETQNLWDLGPNEEVIVNYLVTNYPPSKKGRRENLIDIEWYDLK